MNIKNYLFALTLISLSPCRAMDVEPTEPEKPYLPSIPNPSGQEYVSTLPSDVIGYILTLVVENDPEAIGNLARIQEVCKGFAGFLSKDKLKWILGLTQISLNWSLVNELKKLNLKNVRLLINLGATVEKDAIGQALSSAADQPDQNSFNNLMQIVQILEKKGATWEFNTGWICTKAISYQNLPLIKLLIERGYKPESADFFEAFAKKNIKIIELLLQSGAPVEAFTFARAITITQDPKIVKLLIDHGADVNQPIEYRLIPLVSAIRDKDLPIVQLLLEHGAIIPRGLLTHTVRLLTYTVWNDQNPAIIKLLIKYGADVNEIEGDDHPLPPIAYATNPEIAKILLQAGAQLFIDCERTTPLKELVKTAVQNQDPMILVQVLKTRYPYQTAVAIATALMMGAPYISAVCNIL